MTPLDCTTVALLASVALALWLQVTSTDDAMRRGREEREKREAKKYGVRL